MQRHPRFPVRNDSVRNGKILVMFALVMPVLFGLIGLVVDGGLMMAEHRALQSVADAAATAAARKLAMGESESTARAVAIALIEDFNQLPDTMIEVEIPPAAGPYAGRTGYVRVSLEQTIATNFMHLLSDTGTWTVQQHATAGTEPVTAGAAVIALDPDPVDLQIGALLALPVPLPSLIGGIEVLGLGSVNVEGAVLVNTEWSGFDEDGNLMGENALPPYGIAGSPVVSLSRLAATDIRVVGGVDNPSNYINIDSDEPSPLTANRLPVNDPFEDLPVPTTGADGNNVFTTNYGGKRVLNVSLLGIPLLTPVVLQPGVYDWIEVVSGPVTFKPGVYIIRGANPLTGIPLNILAGPVRAEGVMFYLTNSSNYSATTGSPDSSDGESVPAGSGLMVVKPSAVINLALLGNSLSGLDDPSSPFDGMFIYQRRKMRRPIVIVVEQLLGSNDLSGTIYAKWGHIIFGGNGTFDTHLVAGTIRFINLLNTRIAPTDLLPPAEDVFLVE